MTKQELSEQISYLRKQLDRAKTYKGIEGYPCPLCEYKEGNFVRLCEPHRQLDEADREIARLRKALAKHDVDSRKVILYTDGGAYPNPGPGGWGAVVVLPGGQRKEIRGAEAEATTNNRMELTAVVRGLELLDGLYEGSKKPGMTEVVTDSQYLSNAFNRYWIEKWKKNGWKNASGDPVKNQDLWALLDKLVGDWPVSWRWVKGHAGNPENERCDELASMARLEITAGQRASKTNR